ncbi:MAG: hypothetical protein HYX32_12460 [Actinobacteria bacterium]|nr:hypothetical protein [Actinomycetota bacterium]
MHVDYECLDGSPFPVEFADPADAGLPWVLDREHAPTARPPLAEAVRHAGHAGSERAWDECGLSRPSTMSRQPPRANGYDYVLGLDLPEDEQQALADGLAKLVEQHGGTREVWEQQCLPRAQDACARLRDAPTDTAFATLARWREYAWSHTAIAGAIARRDERAMAALIEPLFGERATIVTYELAQGSDNETMAADRSAWQLAQLDPEATGTASTRRAFLDTYGSRAMSWSIDHPTAVEQPELLDAPLRLIRQRSARDVADVERSATARRRQLVRVITAKLGDDERTTFERRLAHLSTFVPVREARARWQLVATGAMRQVVLRRGRDLARRHVLDDAGDAFYLTPAEYDSPPADIATGIASRRDAHRLWLAVTPPTIIGTASPSADSAYTTAGTLRGLPGAAGVAQGPARVVLDLSEADRLQPGDILVTITTSPPWTPLFGVAAAVVTDAGDALSHVAIAAREYGIPCVVGTNHATATIENGIRITVDGNEGTVHIEA